MKSTPQSALVLSGGGARAAYQAGFLRGLAEIVDDPMPFTILTGTSAGAINCAHLASHLTDGFQSATADLWKLWENLQPNMVFRTGTFSLSGLALKWIAKLTFGGVGRTQRINFLLDTSPLRDLLAKHVDFERIRKDIASGAIGGLAFTATNYQTGTAVCFINSANPVAEEWFRTDRIGIRTIHTLEHVMASSAIPIFFPPQPIDGFFFGDGCIRQTTPLSPPIHLGADRIFTIGIRALRSVEKTIEINRPRANDKIELAEIGGTLLNAVFLDSIEKDAERLERINRTLSLISEERRKEQSNELRPIPFQLHRPSADLGLLARDIPFLFPPALRHMMKGLGSGAKESGSDLISYLAFDGRYTQRLLELGRKDALDAREKILKFFS